MAKVSSRRSGLDMALKETRAGGTDLRRILLQDAWFANLPPALRDLIIERSMRRDFADGATIYAAGDPPTGQFAVLGGQVRLVAHTRRGKLVLYRILQPGSWFGHLAVLDGKPRFQDAIAVGPTSVLHLPMAGFNAIIDTEPRYGIDFAHLVCAHIRLAMHMLAESLTMPLASRLAHVVLSADEGAAEAPSARLTQDMMAAMTGASRQTVNRILRQWQRDGLVTIGYAQVDVHDRRALAALARYEDVHFI